MYAEATDLSLSDVTDQRLIYDFLNAIKSINSSFALNREVIIQNDLKRFELLNIIVDYRDHYRLVKTVLNKPSSYTTFTTLQDKDENKEKKREKCVYNSNWHLLRKCYYLIPNIRPDGWVPRPNMEKQIKKKIKKDSTLKKTVEKTQKKAVEAEKPTEKLIEKKQTAAFAVSI